MITKTRPEISHVVSENDLSRTEPGHLVKVYMVDREEGSRMIYEGSIRDKEAFMEIRAEDKEKEIGYPSIFSWRSPINRLSFMNEEVPRFRHGVCFNHLYLDLVVYTPKSEDYYKKLEALLAI
jgi:hypothetical protein